MAFLRAKREGASRQWLSKLLVVGEGGVGKTSLIKALLAQPHDPAEPTTHGLGISSLPVRHPSQAQTQMRLSVWDFGGQHIYHATHHFFLTNRSLFLLLWNSRLGWEQGRLQYWLDIIKSSAPDSPILLVATHADSSQRPVDLPLDDLRQEYPNIVGNLAIDNQTRSGIDVLQRELAARAASLPLMGAEWPTTWLRATAAVKALPDKRVTPGHLWQIMADAGVTDTEQQQYIAVAMHQLGDILYYHDDEELAQTVVLRPEWVNEYISKVLDSHEVAQQNGLLTRAEINGLWSDLDRGLRDHFLGMMDKYDLSYRVDGATSGAVSLVVERLPWNAPAFQQAWDEMLTTAPASEVRVVYQLDTMPPGIPTWFIARSHRFSTGIHWRNGAMLQHGDQRHRALLRANRQRNTVDLTVRGPTPAAFLSILDDGFNRTLERYPGLEIKRLVPCPCQQGSGKNCAELFEYDDLHARLIRNPPRGEIECRKSGDALDVQRLLLGLTPVRRNATKADIDRLTAMFEKFTGAFTDQAELVQRTLLRHTRVTQDQQEVKCPSVFTIVPVKSGRVGGATYEMRLYCEEPGGWHPLPGDAGRYTLTESPEWLRKLAPYLRYLLTGLKIAAPLAGPVAGMTIGPVSKRVAAELDAMKQIVAQLPEPPRGSDLLKGPGMDTSDAPVAESRAATEADFRVLESLLRRLDPESAWGGLSRTVTPEGLTLYLCREHSMAYRRTVRL
jgi:hypothetical protein